MLTVGTWNLENLFRPGEDGGPADQAAYEAKLAGLAEVINRLAPDVLAVQEVGSPDALEDLTQLLDADWHTELSTFPDRRQIRVGFLSRLPMSDVAHVHTFPTPLAAIQQDDAGITSAETGRGALRVRVSAGGEDVDLVTCHLKSKLLSYPDGRFTPHDEGERARFGAYALYRRAAEAATVRAYANALIDGQGRERNVIVLGDLNDEPLAATTQMLLGPPGSEIGTDGFRRPDRGDAWRLWNLANRIEPPDRRFSRRFDGRNELIDHILVSHALVNRVDSVDTSTPTLPSIGEVPSASHPEAPSDHAAVVARFAID
jgi:endonuclease/exonuclease/phosphatase family metal-dependent hydrolase